jgi:3-hydroxymyristoyl/3-hydroxydecanoyl-(acyl carrier protein) dehydratase
LRAVFSSGGPLTAKAADDAAALFGVAPIEIYGSSESGGIAWRCREAATPGNATDPDPNHIVGDVGDESWAALPGVQWRVDPDEGVLEVRSPHLRDADWLRMADRAAIADSGDNDSDAPRFLLQGRTDRIVKLAEKRISLDAIERRLFASPLVAEARVVLPHVPKSSIASSTAPSRRAGIVAFVVLSESGRVALAANGKLALNRQLKAALSDTVEAVALPRSWRYLEALPLDAQGKTTQAELLALLHSASPPRPTMPNAKLCRQGANNIVLELHIPDNLLYFDGHFDTAPILPGVVQLNWAIGFGRQYFDLPPVFAAVHALKFQKIVTPNSTVTLELQHEPSKAALHFRLHSASGQHASGRIVFAHADVTDALVPASTNTTNTINNEAKSNV